MSDEVPGGGPGSFAPGVRARAPRRSRSPRTSSSACTTAVGARGERAAADYFVACGFEVLGRNVRVGRLEIDLVLRDGPVIAVVEVRTRGAGSWLRPLASIDAKKRARTRAAGAWLWRTQFARDAGAERMRFDAAAVRFLDDGRANVEHVQAAF